MIKPILYALAPHLVNELGHSAIFHETFFAALDRLPSSPCEAHLLLSLKNDFTSLPHSWHPWFKNSKKKFTLFYDYYKVLKKKESSPRIFFQENFCLKELLFLTLLFILLGKKKDSLWLFFRYDFSHLRFHGKLHRFCLFLLGSRVKQFTDSLLIAKDLSHPIVLPIPHTPEASPKREKNKMVHCWWPGEPREAKGKREIIRLLNLEDKMAKEFSLTSSMEISDARMTYYQLPKILSRNEYLAQLEKSDLILLPYDSKVYKSSTSGILVEAIVAGKLVVVKEGSWLSHELRRFGLEELIIDWEDPIFFTHIYPLLFSEEVERKRSLMQEEYKSFHNMDSFGEIIGKAFCSIGKN